MSYRPSKIQSTISRDGRISVTESVEQRPSVTVRPKVQPLPPEILIRVFECFDEDTPWRPREKEDKRSAMFKFDLLPLMLTCQRFRKLVEPILYRRIFIKFNVQQDLRFRKRLLDTLQARSHLFQYIQQLKISFFGGSDRDIGSSWQERGDNEEEDIKAALSFLGKVTPKKISLDGEWASTIDPRLCTALARLELAELQLSDSWGQFCFQYFQSGRSTLLKRLHLYCCSYGLTIGNDQVQTLPPRIHAVNQDSLVEIETLEAGGGDIQADFLYNVCQFIAKLKRFRLGNVMHCHHSKSYCRTSLQKILDLHQDTLEDIELPHFFGPDDKIPNLMGFHSLRRLLLSWDNLAVDAPSVAMQKLAAPLLEHLSIDMDHGDQQCHGLGSFRVDEAKWLTDFAGRRVSGSHLKHLHVILMWNSDTDYGPNYNDEDQPWPNSHLKSLKPVLEIEGVALSWNEPPISEEQWMEMLKGQRHYDDKSGFESESEPEPESSEMDSEAEKEIEILSKLTGRRPRRGSSQRLIRHYFTTENAT